MVRLYNKCGEKKEKYRQSIWEAEPRHNNNRYILHASNELKNKETGSRPRDQVPLRGFFVADHAKKFHYPIKDKQVLGCGC